MNQRQHLPQQDRPINSQATDQLERGPFVDSLERALIVDKFNDANEFVGRRSTGYVVGLTGRWGLGKSSVLNLLEQKLAATDHVIVAVFNPWLFKGRDELIVGFFNALRSAIGRSGAEKARGLIECVDQYREAINIAGHGVAAAIDLHGGAGAATAGWGTWWPRLRRIVGKPKPRTPDQERDSLEKKIRVANCAVVVLIDELDRIEDDEIRAVAQLVKALGDIDGISYLVAYDPTRVVQALGRGEGDERRRSGEHYLEKIIQHPIPLRPLFDDDKNALLNAALVDHGISSETLANKSRTAIFYHLISAIETPREIKRLIGAFAILERAVRGEICPYDVLGYCWLLTKSPAIRDSIVYHIDDLVSDPGPEAMIARVMGNATEQKPDLVKVLGEAAQGQLKILELLFPRFSNQATDDEGERLSRRRNLVRMLYLGNPPNMVRRSELEQLWNNLNQPEVEAALRQLMAEGRLAAFLDRLDDLLLSLPVAGDKTFWVALSKILYRSTDWLVRPEAAGALAKDAANSLFQLAHRDPNSAPRLRAAVDALIASGDLILVPWILRKNMFAHGLTTHSNGPRGDGSLSKKETEELLSRELPRYESAVRDGTALRRLPILEIVFIISHSGNWNDDLRRILTGQLVNMEAISTFAALIVPPGYLADRAYLDKLINAEEVSNRLKDLAGAAEMPSDPWVTASTRRLGAILAGDDPEVFDNNG